MYYVNEDIKNTERVFPEQNRYGYLRYDMNENPEGLPKEFVDSVVKEITPEFLAVYPEPDCFTNKYAKYIGMKFENILATNGSDQAIRYLLETFGEKGKEVVTVAPSFEMYWVNCNILGLKHVPVAYNNDLTINIETIINAISNDTRIVVLLNPNNPVGNVYNDDEVTKVIERAKEVGAIVIIDEAYHYFYNQTFLPKVKEYDNVVILRTFSKLFSIAACRLGVMIANENLINYVKKCKLTFDVNAIALLFGERIIDNPQIEKLLIQIEKEGKQYFIDSLTKKGYYVKDCKGNFAFVRPKHDAHELAKILEEKHKILVKTFGNPLLQDYLRVSIGSCESMELFLKAFYEEDEK